MKRTLQTLTHNPDGTIRLGCDMAADMGLSDATIPEILDHLTNSDPDGGQWRVNTSGRYIGWDVVLTNGIENLTTSGGSTS